MRLVVDANILVSELLRVKGRALLADERLELFVAARAWEEAQHELRKRTAMIAERGHLPEALAADVLAAGVALAEKRATVLGEAEYGRFKNEALARLPNDPDDWPTVALALALEADIWTQDKDFLGCGVATWTSTTLRARLS